MLLIQVFPKLSICLCTTLHFHAIFRASALEFRNFKMVSNLNPALGKESVYGTEIRYSTYFAGR